MSLRTIANALGAIALVMAGMLLVGTLATLYVSPKLELLIQDEIYNSIARHAIVEGCIARSLEDDQLAAAVIRTNGQFCSQQEVMLMQKEYFGLGPCKRDDEKCLFMAAYASVVVFTGQPPTNQEEMNALQKKVDADFQTYKSRRRE